MNLIREVASGVWILGRSWVLFLPLIGDHSWQNFDNFQVLNDQQHMQYGFHKTVVQLWQNSL